MKKISLKHDYYITISFEYIIVKYDNFCNVSSHLNPIMLYEEEIFSKEFNSKKKAITIGRQFYEASK